MMRDLHRVRRFALTLAIALGLCLAAGLILLWAPTGVYGTETVTSTGDPAPDNNAPDIPQTAASPDAVPPTAPGTVYKTYSGTAFTPHGTSSATTAYAGGGGVYRTAGSIELDCLLELPQGARVTEIVYYLRDDNATTDIQYWFATYQPDIGAYSNIASGATTGVQSGAIVQRVFHGSPLTIIDNTRYQYLLEVGLSETASTQVVYGARVGYVPAGVMLPAVLNNSR
jgi:hypothetical protein